MFIFSPYSTGVAVWDKITVTFFLIIAGEWRINNSNALANKVTFDWIMSNIGNNIFCSLLLETLHHYVISLYTPAFMPRGI